MQLKNNTILMQVIDQILFFSLLLTGIICISVLSILYLILPNQQKVKIESKWLSKLWNMIIVDNVKLSIIVFFITFFMFLGISLISTIDRKNFIEGIHVELFGIVFDALVLLLLFNWISSQGERKQRISRYEEEIEDFRYWKSDEAKFRIRGNIKRLNKEGVTKINLDHVDISTLPREPKQFFFEKIKLDKSTFHDSDLSNLRMPNSTFNGVTDFNSRFINSELLYGEFKSCHLQGTDFSNAYLNSSNFNGSVITDNVNFSNAKIRFATFENVTIDSAEFHMAEVTKDFLDISQTWNIKGKNVFEDYVIYNLKKNDIDQFFLIKKGSMDFFRIFGNVD